MSTSHLAPHLAGLGTTIFAEMSALALATNSINLGQGFPDVDGPSSVARAASDAILSGKGNQYPPGPGIPDLLRAVAAHQSARYGLDVDPDREVLITAGATEAIAAAMLALVDHGDEVIALEPFYDSYRATITMARGRCVPVRLDPPYFRLDEATLRKAVTTKSKVILLNSPHNPTGAVLSPAELETVARVALDNDLIVVTDEVYEHLSFDEPHVPMATLPHMWDRTVTISSSGKTFSYTGWKVGWAVGPSELIGPVRTTKQFLTFVSSGPFQYAIAYALNHEMSWVDDLRASLTRRRDLLCAGLVDLGLPTYRPRGTYFVTTDIAPLKWTDTLTFCRELPKRAGVVAVPCSVFYDDPAGPPATLVRWTFTKQESVLLQAMARLDAADLRSP